VSGESLLFLINDILDFSKIEAGKFELSPAAFNLQKMIDTVLRILSSRAEEKQLELVATVKRDVPLRVLGDEGRLRQILINLVGNALKFTEDGGIRIIVSLIERKENWCHVRFEVIDTGIGIPADRQDRLFELFSQVDASTSRTYGGTGLGLAISKKLVELMNGDINVKSELGKGATFTFTVPMKTEPENSSAFDSIISLMNRTQDKIHGQPILIATNSDFQRITLKEQFETWNFTAQIFSSCEETLTTLREANQNKKPFFQVVIDTKLSDGEGEDLVHAIQENDNLSQTPIIYLMQLSDDSAQTQWKVPEKLQFVSKPVQSGMLYNAVTRLLELGEADIADVTAMKSQLNSLQHLRILVAEDNRINQIVIAEILKNAGIDFVLTANGAEVLEKAKNEAFDAVLMDCQMPVMDGFEAAQKIREWEEGTGKNRLPIIALTANVTMDDERRCFEAGMDAYCSKPVEPHRVIELLREWARR
jgi:CheY-like chemotaxis protein